MNPFFKQLFQKKEKKKKIAALPKIQNEMAPPWEVFPTFERYTIGWRMGDGQEYFINWRDFIAKMPQYFDTRLTYLKHHRQAPINWANEVFSILHPSTDDYNKAKFLPELLKLGVVQHDAAYETWINQQSSIVWPWTFSDTPENMARYRTREFWFFSRQLKTMRKSGNLELGNIPTIWQNVEKEIRTGCISDINPKQGLLALSKMFCANKIQPPWKLGLSVEINDYFEMDMEYTNAFQLWIMSSFDDDLLLQEILQKTNMPKDWKYWINEQINFD